MSVEKTNIFGDNEGDDLGKVIDYSDEKEDQEERPQIGPEPGLEIVPEKKKDEKLPPSMRVVPEIKKKKELPN